LTLTRNRSIELGEELETWRRKQGLLDGLDACKGKDFTCICCRPNEMGMVMCACCQRRCKKIAMIPTRASSTEKTTKTTTVSHKYG